MKRQTRLTAAIVLCSVAAMSSAQRVPPAAQADQKRLTIAATARVGGYEAMFLRDEKGGGCWIYVVTGGTAPTAALAPAPLRSCL